MKKRLLVVILAFAVMVTPIIAFAANEQTNQPQAEVLTLDQCLKLAYQNSKQLQSQEKSVVIAKETVRSAESGLFPTMSYTLGAAKYEKGTLKTGYSTEASSGEISVSQNLYTGGMVTCGIKLAKLGLNNALEVQRKTKQQLTYDVKSAYYQAWLAEKAVNVQQASYDNLIHHYQQVKVFFQAGTKSRYDLLQAEVNYQSVKPQLIQAQNNLVLAKLKLATIIGIDKDRQFDVGDEPSNIQLPEKAEFSLQSMLDQAYKDRPELHQLQIANEVDRVQTQMDTAGYKPKVNLTGAYTGSSTDYVPGNWDKSWSLTLGITGNFFDGFKTSATVSKDKETEAKALIDESYQKDNIRLDVQQSIQSIGADLETIASSQANVTLNKENLRLTQTRFGAGMSTSMDIMDAELLLDKASTSYYSSLSDYLTALAKLDLSVGKDN
jgi:outer membrane protein TolC